MKSFDHPEKFLGRFPVVRKNEDRGPGEPGCVAIEPPVDIGATPLLSSFDHESTDPTAPRLLVFEPVVDPPLGDVKPPFDERALLVLDDERRLVRVVREISLESVMDRERPGVEVHSPSSGSGASGSNDVGMDSRSCRSASAWFFNQVS